MTQVCTTLNFKPLTFNLFTLYFIYMIDTAKITIEAGRGGDGASTFRREKYVPKGGPDGGDGGNGGNIYFVATREKNTLHDYARQRQFKAQNGEHGKPKKMHGKTGADLELLIPIGTIIKEGSITVVDMSRDGQKFLIARGGRGGWGNVYFATATHQTPHEYKAGTPGEHKKLDLELKLLADVGIIGLPNAGKSTLLSIISAAKPKIADYPFTTLDPMLGVVNYKGKHFVVADIPGLIEGASIGKGLGDRFLRHIERTKILVHLIAADSADPADDYRVVRNELEQFNPLLLKKKEIIAVSKIDLITAALTSFTSEEPPSVSPEFIPSKPEGRCRAAVPHDAGTLKSLKRKKLFKNAVFFSAFNKCTINKLLDKIIETL